MVALSHYCCRTTLQCQCHVSQAKEQSQYLSATVHREHKTLLWSNRNTSIWNIYLNYKHTYTHTHTCKSESRSRQMTMPRQHSPFSFLQARCPSRSPTNSNIKALKANIYNTLYIICILLVYEMYFAFQLHFQCSLYLKYNLDHIGLHRQFRRQYPFGKAKQTFR